MSIKALSGAGTRSLAFALFLTSLAGCFADPAATKPSLGGTGGGAETPSAGGEGPTAAGGADEPGEAPACSPARGEPIPPRAQVLSADAQPSAQLVFTSDLFSKFRSYCGACHVDVASGGFGGQKVTLQNFARLFDQVAIDRMHSNDPTKVMPPLGSDIGKLWKDRAEDDGVREFADLLEKWIAHDRPKDLFTDEPAQASGVSPFLLSEEVGMGMTNIGNCIPNAAGVGLDSKTSEKLDAFFETATELPVRLEDTDLNTLDAAALARTGVLAFAPAYPLWSDNAKKLRQVRVPVGTSIRFDKVSQTFEIPPNSRFYKTFLKEVKDVDGNPRFKKIETRLIVSRPDVCTKDDTGEHCQTPSLMGSYKWNEDETEATLVRDPRNDGTPFADLKLTYVIDEAEAAKVDDPEAAGLTRHYAIPGSERCVQCHMGSTSKSAILGFLPLQLLRRPKGEGGVIEETNEDELTQLQRLIDYGLITGMDSPEDVVKLEDSQAEPPRNDYELTAQGYMLGNCAHCHNPRGYPSIKNPELASVLQFFPGKTGGIFQFPLDRMSPRLHRGADASQEIPYITPSLRDTTSGDQILGGTGGVIVYTDKTTTVKDASGQSQVANVLAPWRSLIYRNVDTPFTYSEDFVIFPHMPFNTAGYDCRAPRILGDWMVSIPSRVVLVDVEDPKTHLVGPVSADATAVPQPFKEVKPTEPFYDAAVGEAEKRLKIYHEGYRYDFCPDTSDIVDPLVESGKAIVPPDTGYPSPAFPSILVKDGVPDRAHWIQTDSTQVGGDWVPRRSDYADVLLGENQAKVDELTVDKKRVLHIVGLGDDPDLRPLNLSPQFRSFALHEFPMAVWAQKSGCEDALKNQPVPADFTGSQNSDAALDSLPWLLGLDKPPADAPIYATSPGAMVFTQICRNCHGPNADGSSTLADTILTLTGGKTRVANLRDGLLGPQGMPGTARESIFGEKASSLHIATDDLAGRYLAWMALGGTEKPIPVAALVAVANTKVFGQVRTFNQTQFPRPPPASGNMLATGRWLCATWVKAQVGFSVVTGDLDADSQANMPFVRTNGDAAIWKDLCFWDNPAPIRVLRSGAGGNAAANFEVPLAPRQSLSSIGMHPRPLPGMSSASSPYPPGYPVGGRDGKVYPSWDDSNTAPWCIEKPVLEASVANALSYWQSSAVDPTDPIPWCPPELLSSRTFDDTDLNPDQTKWAVRGAANAGLAVFVYLDAIARGLQPKVDYDQCDKLLAQ